MGYYGFVVKLSDFEGIYSFQPWGAAAPLPLKPKHVSGCGNKVEFDLLLGVEMVQYNKVVPCTLSVLHNSNTVTTAPFEVNVETLEDDGEGLRFQVVSAGLGELDEIEVMFAWVGGGDAMKPTLTLD